MDIASYLHIIYTDAEMVLSKKYYGSWREIQDEYPSYKTSLGPWPADDVVEFLAEDYSKLHPSASEQVAAFVASGAETHALTFSD